MAGMRSLLLLLALSPGIFCQGQGSFQGEIEGPSNGKVSVTYLFSVGSDLADVMYRERPTPVMAVHDGRLIAFPLRAGKIGVFATDGELVETIDNPVVTYPSQLSWGGSVLFARDQAGSQLVNLVTKGVEDFSARHWLNVTSPEVAADLGRSGFVLEADATVGWDQHHVYVYQDLILTSIGRVTGDREPVVEAPLGYLLGAVGPRDFLFLNLANECFLISLRNDNDFDRTRIDDLSENRPVVAQLKGPVAPNYAETNKENRRRGWYWDAPHSKLYKVVHAPDGFHFFEYRVAGQSKETHAR